MRLAIIGAGRIGLAINDLLEDGRQKASYKARRTLSKVYRKAGFIIPK